MDGQFGATNSRINNLSASAGAISDSVLNLSTQVAGNTERIREMFSEMKKVDQHTKEIQELRNKLNEGSRGGSIDGAVERALQKRGPFGGSDDVKEKLVKISQEIDRIKAVQSVAKRDDNRTQSTSSGGEEEERRYWWARRAIRAWPIQGQATNDMWRNTGRFLEDKLAVPQGVIVENDVCDIRRLHSGRSTRPKKIKDEVLIVFKDVATRDLVMSYAPNLASWRNEPESVGVRLEVPCHLLGVFKTLEKYGHLVRTTHGENLKRHIKYDDRSMSLVIDVKFPDSEEWVRKTVDDVRCEMLSPVTTRTPATTDMPDQENQSPRRRDSWMRRDREAAPTPGCSSWGINR